ncbi:hypothetical protein [Gilvimarinus chinensis]|uniref:hypothetical protein n=1 Tax=Gilvimarinus chinensis TaxID=396005 RepID=UPI00035C9058|nr:hypothetical protein [Gilvimarinus chinensis]
MQAMSYQIDPDASIDNAARQIREREEAVRLEARVWEIEMPKEKMCVPLGRLIEDLRYSMLAAHAIYRDGISHEIHAHCPKKIGRGKTSEIVVPGHGTYRERRGRIYFRAWGKKIGA